PGPPVAAVGDAVRVSVEEALSPDGGVTLAGLNDPVTPAGSPETERLVAAENPSSVDKVTVRLAVPPWVIDSEGEESPRLKSGVGAGLTVKLKLAPWLCVPAVPVMVTTKGPPVVAEGDADSVSVADALTPGEGVTLAGRNAAVTPAGSPDAPNAVAALNPLRLATVTVRGEVAPWVKVAVGVQRPRLKSGTTPTARVRGAVCVVFPTAPATVRL